MAKFIGTSAFLFFNVCAIILIISMFRRRINRKLWIICTVASLVTLIVSYYVDISSVGYKEKYEGMVQQYSE